MGDERAPFSAGSAARLAAVRALAGSPHPPDRWAAGRALAGRIGQQDQAEVEALLHWLLLDADTATTREVAEALLERRSADAARPVARAVAEADPRDLTFEYLGEAVNNIWLQTYEDAELAGTLCAQLAEDPDTTVRAGAQLMAHLITTGHWPPLPPVTAAPATRRRWRRPSGSRGSLGWRGRRSVP